MGRMIGIDLGTSSARASVLEDGRPVVIAGPVSGSASQMLARPKHDAEARLGVPVTDVVVSISTAFGGRPRTQPPFRAPRVAPTPRP